MRPLFAFRALRLSLADSLRVSLARAGLERGDFYITYEPVGHMLRNSRAITPRNNVLGDAFWHLVGTVRLSSRSSAPARPLSSAPAPAASTQKADSLAHPLVFVRRLRSPYGGGCRPTARSRRRRGGSLPRLRLQGPGGASGRADRAGRMQCTGCSCFRSAQEERERGERPVLLLAQLLGARAACRTFRPLLSRGVAARLDGLLMLSVDGRGSTGRTVRVAEADE